MKYLNDLVPPLVTHLNLYIDPNKYKDSISQMNNWMKISMLNNL